MAGFKLFLFIVVLLLTRKYVVLTALYILYTDCLSQLREIINFHLFVSNTYFSVFQEPLLFLVGF
jgi:hypothetical protein